MKENTNNLEEKLKALEGITFDEWLKLRTTVDCIFLETQSKSTFNVNEDTLKKINL